MVFSCEGLFLCQVCDYHRTFYRPENLCVIITGQINPDDVFKALQPMEEKIASKVGHQHLHTLSMMYVKMSFLVHS